MRIQWLPNICSSERRICLTRIRWESGPGVGTGKDYSTKLSISVCFEPKQITVGARILKDTIWERTIWIYPLPCLSLRIKQVFSWGGVFP